MQRSTHTPAGDWITVSVPTGSVSRDALHFAVWSLADAAWGAEPFDTDVRADGATAVLRASLPEAEQARRDAIDDAVDAALAQGDR